MGWDNLRDALVATQIEMRAEGDDDAMLIVHRDVPGEHQTDEDETEYCDQMVVAMERCRH